MKPKGRFILCLICPMLLMLFCIIQTFTICPLLKVGTALAQKHEQNPENNKKLLDRIDFGNAYIMGQTIKSGAVYLLQRKKSEIKSMLQYRKNYRQEILENFHIEDMKTKKYQETLGGPGARLFHYSPITRERTDNPYKGDIFS